MCAGAGAALVAISPEFTRASGAYSSVLQTVAFFCAVVVVVTAALALAAALSVNRVSATSLRRE
jgi:hypothetical protein